MHKAAACVPNSRVNHMDNWDEVRTAYQVVLKGTVSGAAEALGVHHATVIRHIDALETRLGVKLFQRHARGYTATEAGLDLCRVAQTTDDQFSQLANRIKGQGSGVSGELVVTSLRGMSDTVVPALCEFQTKHPDIRLRYLTGDRLFRLEYGEAHVAIRAGAVPEEPDNVVQALSAQPVALYAADSYVARHGAPASEAELVHHRFVGHHSDASRAPFYRWLRETVPDADMVFRSTDSDAIDQAVCGGVGLGFMTRSRAQRRQGLQEILPPRPEWESPLWLVTHMDLHRTPKVQALLAHLKASAKTWAAT